LKRRGFYGDARILRENRRLIGAFDKGCGNQVPQISCKPESLSSLNIVQIYPMEL
jgi:hypothetical protein